ncbi:MAG TPA: hypothetical protein VM260_02835 [Pirellula sp.]|nr:hypothetical protein [Pirellula sp.]
MSKAEKRLVEMRRTEAGKYRQIRPILDEARPFATQSECDRPFKQRLAWRRMEKALRVNERSGRLA